VFEDEYAGNSLLFRFMFDYATYSTLIDLEPILGVEANVEQSFPGRMYGFSMGYQPNPDLLFKFEFRGYFWGGSETAQQTYLELSQELRREGIDNDATDRMVRFVPAFETILGAAVRVTPEISLDLYGGLTKVLYSEEYRTLISPGLVFFASESLRFSGRFDYHMTELGNISAFQLGIKWIL
jgi:hypothetical protein